MEIPTVVVILALDLMQSFMRHKAAILVSLLMVVWCLATGELAVKGEMGDGELRINA